jgi:hypothetical protein
MFSRVQYIPMQSISIMQGICKEFQKNLKSLESDF